MWKVLQRLKSFNNLRQMVPPTTIPEMNFL